MEIIFLAGAAAIVWLYLFNATLSYVMIGGGYLAILITLLASRILRARRAKVRIAPLPRLEPALRVSPLPGPGIMAGGGGQ
jgi:hypothetical protein